MNRKVFVLFGVATIVLAAAAGISTTLDRPSRPAGGGKMLPGLIDRVNQVDKIVIQHGQGKLTVKRRGDGWTLVEKDGYPVPVEKVRKTLLGLAQLEQLEKKTRKKDRYAELNLRDPEEKGAKSRKLTLLDKNDAVIAQVIVGKRKRTLGGEGGVYLRKVGEAQTWLTIGNLDPDTQARNWLINEIIDLAAARVARVTIHHPDGELLGVSKSSIHDAHFGIEDLPEGVRMKSTAAADPLASILVDFEFDDVRKDEAVGFAGHSLTQIRVATFDGLNVLVDIIEKDGSNWVRIQAEAADGAKPPKDREKAKDVAGEASALNARAAGWAYLIPNYQINLMRKKLSDLIAGENKKKSPPPG